MQSVEPSTSHNNGEERITAEELNRIIEGDDSKNYAILDCRSDGPSLKFATRVRLPVVLLRRLMGGSLPLSNVSQKFQNATASLRVILITGTTTSDEQISNALINVLKTNAYNFSILSDPVPTVLSKFPQLNETFEPPFPSPNQISSDVTSAKPPSGGPPVGFLNLNSLRLGTDHQTGRQRAEFPVQIASYLFLGNAETARNREVLDRHNISYVINVTSNLPNVFEDDPNMRYLRISVDDNASHNLTRFFQEAIAFIDEARLNDKACLVHCLAGISRSVTICLAYLMKTNRCSLENAYDCVQNKNASIAPNFHFMGQLSDFERTLGVHSNLVGTYPSSAPRSPSCAIEAAQSVGLLTPPPTSCSASPQSSTHSAKSFH